MINLLFWLPQRHFVKQSPSNVACDEADSPEYVFPLPDKELEVSDSDNDAADLVDTDVEEDQVDTVETPADRSILPPDNCKRLILRNFL